jgi:hypothetical protein
MSGKLVKVGDVVVIEGIRYYFDETTCKTFNLFQSLPREVSTMAEIGLLTDDGKSMGLFPFSKIEKAVGA